MRWVLYALAALSLLMTLGAMANAKTELHVIQACLFFLTFAVFLCGAAVCSLLKAPAPPEPTRGQPTTDLTFPPNA